MYNLKLDGFWYHLTGNKKTGEIFNFSLKSKRNAPLNPTRYFPLLTERNVTIFTTRHAITRHEFLACENNRFSTLLAAGDVAG